METEGYIGPGDRASHSYGNRRTKRTEIMFGEAGYVYTFLAHTHTLVNVVSGLAERPEGILIRAIEPVEGIDLMIQVTLLNQKNQVEIIDVKPEVAMKFILSGGMTSK